MNFHSVYRVLSFQSAMARWLLVALMAGMVVSNSLGAAHNIITFLDAFYQLANFTDQSADATFDHGTDNREDAKDIKPFSWQVKPPHFHPTDKDECARNPCQHGGSCVNKDGGYTCICSSGWTGQDCQQDIDECASKPCQNGTCDNKDGGYTCHRCEFSCVLSNHSL
ncbi:uncharacterized protein LOC144916521 [Branchiostoma floridae x Branchiostoma belcheri]